MDRTTHGRLQAHVEELRRCRRCPKMRRPSVSGGPVVSRVMLVGQAPGDKEPRLGRPFAWTAGKTLFRWFEEHCGLDEAAFRASIYMAAVCRCFPGKKPAGGDRVPGRDEIENCSSWMEAEFRILRPELVIPVGKLAIEQFVDYTSLSEIVGKRLNTRIAGRKVDLIPLPHPSGASPWPRMEPGKSLLKKALRRIARHPTFASLSSNVITSSDETGRL